MASEDERDRNVVKQVIDDIVHMHYCGNVRAIAFVAIDKEGDVRATFGFGNGGKLPLMAGVQILARDLLETVTKIDKNGD